LAQACLELLRVCAPSSMLPRKRDVHFVAGRNSVNSALGALRILGKKLRISSSTSASFAASARSLLSLKHEVEIGVLSPPGNQELEHRLHQLGSAAALQQSLEQEFGLPHRHCLGLAVRDARECGEFSSSALSRMEEITHHGNSARHRRWRSPSPSGVWQQVVSTTPPKSKRRRLCLDKLVPSSLLSENGDGLTPTCPLPTIAKSVPPVRPQCAELVCDAPQCPDLRALPDPSPDIKAEYDKQFMDTDKNIEANDTSERKNFFGKDKILDALSAMKSELLAATSSTTTVNAVAEMPVRHESHCFVPVRRVLRAPQRAERLAPGSPTPTTSSSSDAPASPLSVLNFCGQEVLQRGDRFCRYTQQLRPYDPVEHTIASLCVELDCEPSEFEGELAHLAFLQSAPELNGKVVKIRRALPNERLAVQVHDRDQELSCSASCLIEYPGPFSRQCVVCKTGDPSDCRSDCKHCQAPASLRAPNICPHGCGRLFTECPLCIP